MIRQRRVVSYERVRGTKFGTGYLLSCGHYVYGHVRGRGYHPKTKRCPACEAEAAEKGANAAERTRRFEHLWGTLVAKRARLRNLKLSGRTGYQLHMPKLAVNRAAIALWDEFPDEALRLGVRV